MRGPLAFIAHASTAFEACALLFISECLVQVFLRKDYMMMLSKKPALCAITPFSFCVHFFKRACRSYASMDYSTFVAYLLPILVSGVVYSVYRASCWLYGIVLYKVTITLEITTDDFQTWTWLQSYIARELGQTTRSYCVENGTSIRAASIPLPVTVYFEGKRVRMSLADRPQSQMVLMQHQTSEIRRSAVLWVRQADPRFFERFLKMLKEEHLKHAKDTIRYSLPQFQSGDAYWRAYKTGTRRDFATLTLDPILREKIEKDLQFFVHPDTRLWYKDHGIPYRRGWLLHGLPGNGKSSIIAAVASTLGSDVHLLSLSAAGMDDVMLSKLMIGANRDDSPYIFVIEDIDCLFGDRAAESVVVATQNDRSRVTLAGLLNALDGVGAANNVLIIITTNYPERLDAALTRPGRVDLSLKLDVPDDSRIAAHYIKFFPAETRFSEATLAFVQECREAKGKTCSMADVQGIIMSKVASSR